MDLAEFNLYSKLAGFGINPAILSLLPEKASDVFQENEKCFVFKCHKQQIALWICRCSESLADHQTRLIDFFSKKVKGFLRLYTVNGNLYNPIGDNCWFYLTEWDNFNKVSFSNISQIKSLVGLTCAFRKTFEDNQAVFTMMPKETGKLVLKYEEMLKNLDTFFTLGKCRLRPTIFDRLFLDNYGNIKKQAEYGLELLNDSTYLEKTKYDPNIKLCINNFNRSNLRTNSFNEITCLSLTNYSWELPILDLALLLVKTGRSNKWSSKWYNGLLSEYENYYEITNEEMKILHAFIAFPWAIYRLAMRYYHNKTNWPVSLFFMKMKRALDDEPKRVKLVEGITQE